MHPRLARFTGRGCMRPLVPLPFLLDESSEPHRDKRSVIFLKSHSSRSSNRELHHTRHRVNPSSALTLLRLDPASCTQSALLGLPIFTMQNPDRLGRKGTHATLRRYWGSDHMCSLNSRSLEVAKKSVPFDLSEETFHDAIHITRTPETRHL